MLRSSFVTEGDDSSSSDNGNNREFGRIGRRYIGVKEKRDKLWTEITKDLVVREAIERAGYEYEETEYFYYIFEYLRYVCSVPLFFGYGLFQGFCANNAFRPPFLMQI